MQPWAVNPLCPLFPLSLPRRQHARKRYAVPMPRPLLHATMPGPTVGGGPLAIVFRVLMLGMALVFAFFLVIVAFVVGGFFLVLRALGIGGKATRPSPFAPFGATFAGAHGRPTAAGQDATEAVTEEPEDPMSQEDTVKQLEEFHGSLDEFLQQRKGQKPS